LSQKLTCTRRFWKKIDWEISKIHGKYSKNIFETGIASVLIFHTESKLHRS
jgi:hypothetical protein